MAQASQRVTKAELAKQLATVGLSCRHAGMIVEYFFAQWAQAIKRGEVLHWVGFGSFQYKTRPPRLGRNPKTGEKVAVPSKRIVHFTAGKELKKLVREERGQGGSHGAQTQEA
jgi:nucleoid DNA-binding protein